MSRQINGPKEQQIFSFQPKILIQYQRPEVKKPLGKKKKWTYRPNEKEGYAKTF